jgi:hypothetical protein
MVRPVLLSSLGKWWPLCLALAFALAVVVIPGAPAPPAPLAAPAPRATISVHVAAQDAADAGRPDTLADCSQPPASGAHAPIAGARLRVFSYQAGRYVLAAQSLGDAAGRAQLPLEAGAYWLLVDAPGRARRSLPLSVPGALDPCLLLAPAEPFSVEVRDTQGQPIAGATVLVRGIDDVPFGALTAASGLARLEHVGAYVESVRAFAPGHDSVLVNPTSRQLSVTLSAPAALEVLVQQPSGQPAPSAEVWVSGIDFWPPRQLSAGPDGLARLEGLARGTYDLRARLGSAVSPALPGVALERGERERVTLTLSEGRFISVRVRAGEGEGAAPVAGAAVTLVEDGLSPFPLSGRTTDDGSSVLGPVPVGDAVLSVRAEGFMPESVTIGRRSSGDVEVALVRAGRVTGRVVDADGRAIEGARLEVVGNDLRGRPIARQSGGLDLSGGFFERSLAAPLPLVPMGELGVLSGPLPVPGMPPPGPAPRSAWISDLDGNYRLDDVPPGRLRVLAKHPDFVEAMSEPALLDAGGALELRLVLARGATLSGHVLDELGRPVARARIDAASRQATQASTLSGPDGAFVFRALPERVELLLARPEARQRFVLRKALVLASGETQQLELRLPPERPPLRVVVLGEAGRPLEGAALALLSLDPGVPLRQSLQADVRGEGVFGDAVGLVATLRVQAAGWQSFETTLDPVPARVEVTLTRGISVRGRVTQTRGRRGVAGAEVVLFQGGQRRSVLTDANGEYEVSGVVLGPASLSVRHADFSSETWDVSIEPGRAEGRAQDLEAIDLEEPGFVSGRVLDARGQPVRGARVGAGLVPAFVPAQSKQSGFVETDAGGRFELRDLAPGRSTLSAYAPGVGRGSLPDVTVTAGEQTTGLEIQLRPSRAEIGSTAPANVAVTLGERTLDGDLEVVIVNVAAGSEAERAGVRAGDVLWSVDDEVVLGMAEAREALGGSQGSDVILELERDGESELLRVRREAVR